MLQFELAGSLRVSALLQCALPYVVNTELSSYIVCSYLCRVLCVIDTCNMEVKLNIV